jgi:hypothetical protein
MILIQEADEFAYRCAFTCQKQAYIVRTNKGEHDFKNKYTKTDIVNYFKKKGKQLDVDYTVEGYVLIDPPHIVKHTLDRMINKLWYVGELMEPYAVIHDVHLWLSPSDHSNFRYSIAELMGPRGAGYKAGRGPKPHYLKFIKELLINEYGAREIQGFEADDALGIYADQDAILSHIDKDMNMIEGWHYNHVTEEAYYVPAGLGEVSMVEGKVVGRGLKFFYLQLLTGDAIDNIPGCINKDKVHHSKPPQISNAVGVAMLSEKCTEKDCFDTVADAFKFTYKDNWCNALMECADLLWICRKNTETGRQYLKSRGFL